MNKSETMLATELLSIISKMDWKKGTHGDEIVAEVNFSERGLFNKILAKAQSASASATGLEHFKGFADANNALHAQRDSMNQILTKMGIDEYCIMVEGTTMTITFNQKELAKLKEASMPLPALGYQCLQSPFESTLHLHQMLQAIDENLKKNNAKTKVLESSVGGLFENGNGFLCTKPTCSENGLAIEIPNLQSLFSKMWDKKKYAGLPDTELCDEAMKIFTSLGMHPRISIRPPGAGILFKVEDAAIILSSGYPLPESLAQPLNQLASKWIYQQLGENSKREHEAAQKENDRKIQAGKN